jgi:geranylgeranylglycerol-phosphate geranylgeranyltransferase
MIGGSAINHSIIFALIAFLANTGREVTKGIVDVEGDQAMGIRTVAISMGVMTAALVSVVFYLSAVIVSILPLYYGFVSFWYFPFVVVTDIGLIYISFSLIRDSSRENSRRIKNLVRMLMLCGLFGFLVGSLT